MTDILKKPNHATPGHHLNFFYALAFTVWTAFLLILGNVAIAQTTPLTDAELITIESQFTRAKAVSMAMEAKLQCFVTKDVQYEERSRVLQKEIGALYLTEADLRHAFMVAEEEEEAFSKQVAEIQSKMHLAQLQLAKVNARLQAANRTLKKCKDDAWIFSFACDVYHGIFSGLKGEISDLEARQKTTEIRLKSAAKQHSDASLRLKQSRDAHAQASAALHANQVLIQTNENELGAIKSALSELRIKKQEYASTQSSFAAAYEDFKALDPNSERSFLIRKLRILSQEMAVALTIAEAIANNDGLLLPSGARICAARPAYSFTR